MSADPEFGNSLFDLLALATDLKNRIGEMRLRLASAGGMSDEDAGRLDAVDQATHLVVDTLTSISGSQVARHPTTPPG